LHAGVRAATLARVQLAVAGHPLHTRALAVTLTGTAGGRLAARASLLDLRKGGFVPVAGDLQAAGIIHQMILDGVVDPASRVLETIVAAQPAVAFEASAATAGEACRDPADRVAGLAGARLDADFARRVSAVIGGPRGCSHLATLAHFLCGTVGWALDATARASAGPGERYFRRDLVIDGHLPAPGRLVLALQLGDLHLVPAPPLAPPMERFGAHLELRVLVDLDLRDGAAITAIAAAERRRAPADLADASWHDRAADVGPLVGLRLWAGATAALLDRLGGHPEDRPLLDSLLMLAPALVQCAAALSDAWPAAFQASPSIVGMGGLPDSCYMWRRDGALSRAREVEGTAPPPRLW
jgi:hypothetical protein